MIHKRFKQYSSYSFNLPRTYAFGLVVLCLCTALSVSLGITAAESVPLSFIQRQPEPFPETMTEFITKLNSSSIILMEEISKLRTIVEMRDEDFKDIEEATKQLESENERLKTKLAKTTAHFEIARKEILDARTDAGALASKLQESGKLYAEQLESIKGERQMAEQLAERYKTNFIITLFMMAHAIDKAALSRTTTSAEISSQIRTTLFVKNEKNDIPPSVALHDTLKLNIQKTEADTDQLLNKNKQELIQTLYFYKKICAILAFMLAGGISIWCAHANNLFASLPTFIK